MLLFPNKKWNVIYDATVQNEEMYSFHQFHNSIDQSRNWKNFLKTSSFWLQHVSVCLKILMLENVKEKGVLQSLCILRFYFHSEKSWVFSLCGKGLTFLEYIKPAKPKQYHVSSNLEIHLALSWEKTLEKGKDFSKTWRCPNPRALYIQHGSRGWWWKPDCPSIQVPTQGEKFGDKKLSNDGARACAGCSQRAVERCRHAENQRFLKVL